MQNSSLTAEVASLKAKLAQIMAHAEEYQRQVLLLSLLASLVKTYKY
jgi:hypothetical protein